MEAAMSWQACELPGRARLYMDDVGAPVVADIADRSSVGFTVTRPLPFLELDRQVMDDEGRLARIASVRIATDDGTPRLLMDLVWEQQPRPARRDETVPYEASVAQQLSSCRGEDTVVFDTMLPEGEQRVSQAPVALYEPSVNLAEELTAVVRHVAGFARQLTVVMSLVLRELRTAFAR